MNAAIARRDRSYRVQRTVPVNSRVEFLEDAYWQAPIAKGTYGTVVSYFNAGFNGIQATVRLDDGRRVVVSAGYLA